MKGSMMSRTYVSFLVIVILSLSLSVYGSNYYVDAVKGANDKTGTSAENPWKTITHALSKAYGTIDDQAVIHVAAGTYDMALGETFPLVMKGYVTLQGAAKETTIIDASGSNKSAIYCENISGFVMSGLSITGGNAAENGGGLYAYDSVMQIENCIATANYAGLLGGGFYLEHCEVDISSCNFNGNSAKEGGGIYFFGIESPTSGELITVKDCLFEDNAVEYVDEFTGGKGGGFYCGAVSPVIERDTFNNNSSVSGGGLYLEGMSPKISGCKFESNTAKNTDESLGSGGGMYSSSISPVIENCIFENNISLIGGGFQLGSTNPTIKFCQFKNNTAINQNGDIGSGGGLNGALVEPVIEGCEFAGNISLNGGGANFTASYPIIKGCNFTDNIALNTGETSGSGGGMYIKGTGMEIINCDFTNNKSNLGGGFYTPAAKMNIENSTFDNNVAVSNSDADGLGGGIYLSKAVGSMTGCKVSNNIAVNGGGLYGLTSIIDCQDSQILSNKAQIGGGSSWELSSIGFANCIIKGNTASSEDSNYGIGGWLFSKGQLVLNQKNCLITNNSAKNGSIIFLNEDSQTNMTILNSTIAANGASSGHVFTLNGEFANSLSDCIVRDNGSSLVSNTTSVKIYYTDIEGGFEGEGNIDQDPLFIKGPDGDYYLSQEASGQSNNSPCIDKGSDTAINLGLDTRSTRIDKVPDDGMVDIGFHYPGKIPTGELKFDLSLAPQKQTYTSGDSFNLLIDIQTPSTQITADIYFVLLQVDSNTLYFGTKWDTNSAAVLSGFSIPPNLSFSDALLMSIYIPKSKPTGVGAGTYAFAVAAAEPGTFNFISNIASVSFNLN
jgi:hypothetical protein